MIDPSLATNIGTAAGIGSLSILALWKIVQKLELRLEEIIVPKLNRVCIRTQRIEVAQSHIINALEDEHPNLRDEILDEIDLRGIPRMTTPIGAHRAGGMNP